MKTRSHRRAVVAATVLALALSTPLAAAAAGDQELPQLDQTDSSTPPETHFRLDETPVSSNRSAEPKALAAAEAPGAVTGVTIGDVTSTDAHAAWAAPADNGSTITGYHLQILIGGSVIEEFVSDTPVLGATLFNLAPDTTYGFRVAAVNAIGTGDFSAVQSFTTTHTWVERQFGADRFETAVRVSESAFPYEGVPVTFIANGLNFPDALAAAAAAGTFGGPVLLARPTSVSAGTVAEVAALKPEYLFAAGGKAVVGDSVFNKLSPYATMGSDRAAGASRYETAGLISTLWESTGTVYLANGMNFPDALAGAAAAGYEGAPVLLTKQGSLPPETAAYLAYHRPTRLVILGGNGAVSQAVVDQAQRAAGGFVASIQRLSGDSRYDTAVDISRRTFTTPRVPVVYIASGQNFADALAGAAAAGALGGPVLLTEPNTISDATIAEIERLDPVRVVVLGGPAVVSDAVKDRIANAID
ncbi:cell wall-binding repeat-containing protein [Microbacterium sp. NPDC028030]|uniref:cell wall-binding repeat-containing protein n=1 Tax=Microbacterium sp. NPDC028030 TaxID=3155124 RepID=UPI0033E90331